MLSSPHVQPKSSHRTSIPPPQRLGPTSLFGKVDAYGQTIIFRVQRILRGVIQALVHMRTSRVSLSANNSAFILCPATP